MKSNSPKNASFGVVAERLEEPGARVVEVREPVRVEDDALLIDLGVAGPEPVDERRAHRVSPELGVVGLHDRVDRPSGAASPISSSVSVRSGARKRSAKARLRRPAPSDSRAELVEAPHRLEQCRRAVVAQRPLDVGGRHRLGQHEREVDGRRREPRQRTERAVPPRPAEQPVDVELERHRGPGIPNAVEHRRARARRRDRSCAPSTVIAALRAGSKPGGGAGHQPEVGELERLAERVERVDGVVDVDRPVRLDRDCAAHVPVSSTARWSRSSGRSCRPARRGEHVAELEQREVGETLAGVERRRLEQAGQDRRAEDRLLGPQRVRGLDGPVGRAGRTARGPRAAMSGTVIASDAPDPDQHVRDQAPLALARREPAADARSCAAACAGSR